MSKAEGGRRRGTGQPLSRRSFFPLAASALAGCAAREEQVVAGCPGVAGQTVRWIVGYTPGGGYDVYSRILERSYENTTGAEIVISYEPGAGGLLGATKLRDAAPDGKTLGILNGPGLMAASLSSDTPYPNPARDFDIIGRLQRNVHAILTGADTGPHDLAELLELQRGRRLLAGLTGLASSNVMALAVSASLVGLELDYIPGYPGSREELLGAMRGEVDIISATYESVRSNVASGDLRVLMQYSDGPIADDPELEGVPWLAGPDGWAARRAAEGGRTPEQAQADAAALIEYLGSGTVVAAPKGIPPDLLRCLRAQFLEAARTPEFAGAAEAARRTMDVAGGEEALAELAAAESTLARFASLVRDVIARAR